MGIKEDVYFEGGPHWGDLVLNILLGFTVICLPFTFGAVVRALWLRFRITNRRVTVIGGWLGRDRSDIIYSEIREVRVVPRGLGWWGDMVLTLKDGSRIEMRSLPKFRDTQKFIEDKMESRPQSPVQV
jgi:hypothetical protein